MSASLEIKFDRRFSEITNSYIMWVEVLSATPSELFYCLKVQREDPEQNEPEQLVSLMSIPEIQSLLYQQMDCLYAPDLVAAHGSSIVGKTVTFYPPPPVIEEFSGDVPIDRQIIGFHSPLPLGSPLLMTTDFVKLDTAMNSFAYNAPYDVAALGFSSAGTIQRAPQRYPYSIKPYSRDFVHIAEYDSLGDVTTLFEQLKVEAEELVAAWNRYEDDFEGTHPEVFE